MSSVFAGKKEAMCDPMRSPPTTMTTRIGQMRRFHTEIYRTRDCAENLSARKFVESPRRSGRLRFGSKFRIYKKLTVKILNRWLYRQ